MGNYEFHVKVYKFLRAIAAPMLRFIFKYHAAVVRDVQPPFIVLANHVINLDPVLLGITFKQHMYYVASEHVYRAGFFSWLLARFLAPIARTKGTTDARAVMDILKQLKMGHNVGLFAEGNRTYNGVTGPILASTGKLVKASGATLVTFLFEGGYFTNPRWAKSLRRGGMSGKVVNIYPPDKLKSMSNEEVQQLIERDLFEDAYAKQAEKRQLYPGRNLAEFLEMALYICPRCGEIGKLRSEGDAFFCACGLRTRYQADGELQGEAPFKTVLEWDIWQETELRNRLKRQKSALLLEDENERLYIVSAGEESKLHSQGRLTMNAERLTCGDFQIETNDISNMAIFGKMTLVFSTTDGKQYEIKAQEPRSARKYLTLFQALQEMR